VKRTLCRLVYHSNDVFFGAGYPDNLQLAGTTLVLERWIPRKVPVFGWFSLV